MKVYETAVGSRNTSYQPEQKRECASKMPQVVYTVDPHLLLDFQCTFNLLYEIPKTKVGTI